VGRLALGSEAATLGDAETVLFVDDGQGQVAEADAILEQRVGADRHLRVAIAQLGQAFLARHPFAAPSQQHRAHALGGERTADRFIVLARQNLRGRHEHRLQTGRRDIEDREHGDDRLAGADVTLQETGHPQSRPEVGADVLQRAGLGARQLERQRRPCPFGDGARRHGGGWNLTPAPLARRERQLMRQQLVERQPPSLRRLRGKVGFGVRVMHSREGRAPARPPLAAPPGGIEPFGRLGGPLQGQADKAANRAGGQAGRRGIDRFGKRDLAGPFDRQ